MRFPSLNAVLGVLASMAAGASHGAILSGSVTDAAGAPVLGAMVTVFNEAKDRKETVYSSQDGSYVIRTDFGGRLAARARHPNVADVQLEQVIGVGQAVRLDFVLRPFATPQAASDALTASAHNAHLPWASDSARKPFVSQCMYCHQVGNALTRTPRPQQAWSSTIERMEGYFAMLSTAERRDISSVLARGFDGKPVAAVHSDTITPELGRAKVEQWLVGDPMSFIHDADVGDDGKLYGTDEGHDIIWVLDRNSGKIEQYPLPASDLPVGGVFAGMKLPIGIFTGKHGPHSMAQAKDGRFWITNALSSTIMSFDPVSKAFKVYPVPGDVLYPHTIRIDGAGIVWFTNVASNQVGRFDPTTEQFKVMRLPSNGLWRWVSDMLFPTVVKLASWFPQQNLHLTVSHQKWLGHDILAFPYGIDVNPKDGSIWYAKLYASKIGRIDPITLAITEFDTPMQGPRRPRFDRNGVLWIPSFDDGGLMAFDTATSKFDSIKLPVLAKGEHEVPYALAVDPANGDVWITANNSDRVLRYRPSSKAFLSFPSPTRVTVLRDLAFTKDGRVCSSTSNLPAYAMEDGRDAFICFHPEGGAQDRAALAGNTAAPLRARSK